MPISSSQCRGVSNIRTASNRTGKTPLYKIYMRITSIEMEKARRGKERESALRRLRDIAVQFQQIEREKDALLNAAGERSGGAVQPKQTARLNRGALTFKY